ncbi:hypothetical protein [Kitasatospora sp. NPDC093102]|uniref:hypothetical protein n=1 Tax=Kitasatospora sp. NPDC093102 TaxID=3155069 RepID=UPI003434B2FE
MKESVADAGARVRETQATLEEGAGQLEASALQADYAQWSVRFAVAMAVWMVYQLMAAVAAAGGIAALLVPEVLAGARQSVREIVWALVGELRAGVIQGVGQDAATQLIQFAEYRKGWDWASAEAAAVGAAAGAAGGGVRLGWGHLPVGDVGRLLAHPVAGVGGGVASVVALAGFEGGSVDAKVLAEAIASGAVLGVVGGGVDLAHRAVMHKSLVGSGSAVYGEPPAPLVEYTAVEVTRSARRARAEADPLVATARGLSSHDLELWFAGVPDRRREVYAGLLSQVAEVPLGERTWEERRFERQAMWAGEKALTDWQVEQGQVPTVSGKGKTVDTGSFELRPEEQEVWRRGAGELALAEGREVRTGHGGAPHPPEPEQTEAGPSGRPATTAQPAHRPEVLPLPGAHPQRPTLVTGNPRIALLSSTYTERVMGMPHGNQVEFQRIADRFDVVIEVRPTNPGAVARLAEGALPKPPGVKAKTINELDVHLGARPEDLSLVGLFEPVLPNPLPEAEARQPGLRDRIEQRYRQRRHEYQELAPQLSRDPAWEVRDGLVWGRNRDGEPRPITGDHDIYDIFEPTGKRPTQERYEEIVAAMREADMGVQHGAHLYWTPQTRFEQLIFDRIVDDHVEGARPEPLLRFIPNVPRPVISEAHRNAQHSNARRPSLEPFLGEAAAASEHALIGYYPEDAPDAEAGNDAPDAATGNDADEPQPAAPEDPDPPGTVNGAEDMARYTTQLSNQDGVWFYDPSVSPEEQQRLIEAAARLPRDERFYTVMVAGSGDQGVRWGGRFHDAGQFAGVLHRVLLAAEVGDRTLQLVMHDGACSPSEPGTESFAAETVRHLAERGTYVDLVAADGIPCLMPQPRSGGPGNGPSSAQLVAVRAAGDSDDGPGIVPGRWKRFSCPPDGVRQLREELLGPCLSLDDSRLTGGLPPGYRELGPEDTIDRPLPGSVSFNGGVPEIVEEVSAVWHGTEAELAELLGGEEVSAVWHGTEAESAELLGDVDGPEALRLPAVEIPELRTEPPPSESADDVGADGASDFDFEDAAGASDFSHELAPPADRPGSEDPRTGSPGTDRTAVDPDDYPPTSRQGMVLALGGQRIDAASLRHGSDAYLDTVADALRRHGVPGVEDGPTLRAALLADLGESLRDPDSAPARLLPDRTDRDSVLRALRGEPGHWDDRLTEVVPHLLADPRYGVALRTLHPDGGGGEPPSAVHGTEHRTRTVDVVRLEDGSGEHAWAVLEGERTVLPEWLPDLVEELEGLAREQLSEAFEWFRDRLDEIADTSGVELAPESPEPHLENAKSYRWNHAIEVESRRRTGDLTPVPPEDRYVQPMTCHSLREAAVALAAVRESMATARADHPGVMGRAEYRRAEEFQALLLTAYPVLSPLVSYGTHEELLAFVRERDTVQGLFVLAGAHGRRVHQSRQLIREAPDLLLRSSTLIDRLTDPARNRGSGNLWADPARAEAVRRLHTTAVGTAEFEQPGSELARKLLDDRVPGPPVEVENWWDEFSQVSEVLRGLDTAVGADPDRSIRRMTGLGVESGLVLGPVPVRATEPGPSYLDDPEAFVAAVQRARERGGIPYLIGDGVLGGQAEPEGGRTFGIELTIVFPPGTPEAEQSRRLAAMMSDFVAEGLSKDTRWYDHDLMTAERYTADPDGWRFQTEKKVAAELISPVLRDTELTWRNLGKACDIVTRHGGLAPGGTGGGHINIGTGDFGHEAARYSDLVGAVRGYEDLVYRLAGDPRQPTHRGIRACRPNEQPPAEGFRTLKEVYDPARGRYWAVNLVPVDGRTSARVEFRSPGASLDKGAIQSHVRLAYGLVDAVAAHRNRGVPLPQPPYEPVGSHHRTAGTGKALTGRALAEDGRSARRLIDLVAHDRAGKAQLAALFAHTEWQRDLTRLPGAGFAAPAGPAGTAGAERIRPFGAAPGERTRRRSAVSYIDHLLPADETPESRLVRALGQRADPLNVSAARALLGIGTGLDLAGTATRLARPLDTLDRVVRTVHRLALRVPVRAEQRAELFQDARTLVALVREITVPNLRALRGLEALARQRFGGRPTSGGHTFDQIVRELARLPRTGAVSVADRGRLLDAAARLQQRRAPVTMEALTREWQGAARGSGRPGTYVLPWSALDDRPEAAAPGGS